MIINIEPEELTAIIAGLVKEGLTFEACKSDTHKHLWNIQLTGGF